MGSDYNDTAGWLQSSLYGLLHLPADNWEYAAGGSDWVADNTLYISY